MSGESFERRVGLADMHGTVAEVRFTPEDGEGEACVHAGLSVGSAPISAMPTPEALRQWAAALLDAADAMEN